MSILISAIIKCDEEPIDNASYNPWGRHGGGAPIRDQQGNLVTQVGGRWKSDQIVSHLFIVQNKYPEVVFMPLKATYWLFLLQGYQYN